MKLRMPKFGKQSPGGKQSTENRLINLLAQALFVLILIALLYSLISDKKVKTEDVPLSQVAAEIREGKVEKIVLKGDKLDITLTDETKQKSKKEPEASLAETFATYGLTPEEISSAPVEVKNQSGVMYWILTIVPILIPIAFIAIFFWFISGQMKGSGGMKAFSFGQSKARLSDPNDAKKKVTFKEVAGNQEAKIELGEMVDFLKNPKKFFDIGAKVPKGVLLTGLPGTGKTLLARAVAGEAQVPFFYLSGSEFVEMFVGVGASRVRDLFEQAKKIAPAIIFIDEIDAVGRARGVGFGGGNDEREQTLNQILVEMDGFEPTEKVIVIAATNRPDVLDPALLRPGRFDRRVILDAPDRRDREAILNIHANEKPLADDVDLKLVAERTPGFSGADLESLMNEAAILAARENRSVVIQSDVLISIEKVMIGPERKSHLHTPHERKIVAFHEAGHAIVATSVPYGDPVHKVSIVARGYAGGYTLKLPLEETKLPSKKELMDDLAIMLGGYAAEKLVFKDITTGPSNDLQVATRTARNMVMKWGMSDALGPIAFKGADEVPSAFGEGMRGNEYSDVVEAKIDEEVSLFVREAEKRAEQILIKHRGALDAVAEKLLEVETLEQDAYNELVAPFGLRAKEKKE